MPKALNDDDAVAVFTATYRSILSQYGSAPFLLRTGKKGSEAFSHYATAIVERKDNNKYQIRFENPSSSKSDIYDIKGETELNNVLMNLHRFYMNGNPANNLDNNPIDGPLVGMENLGTHSQISRASQTGMQCGIHSSRRIIPDSIYDMAGLKDCDILNLSEL